MLGIFPGWGGMLRLPRLIGAPAALDMMLTGRGADARRAAALGLADARVPPRLLEAAARATVLSGKPVRQARGLAAWTNRWPLKAIVANRARKQIAAKDPLGHYPAAPAIVTLWEQHDGDAQRAPSLIDGIIASDTARNLLRVFRLQERLKANGRQPGGPGAAHPCGRRRRHGRRHRRLVRLQGTDRHAAGPGHGPHRARHQARRDAVRAPPETRARPAPPWTA